VVVNKTGKAAQRRERAAAAKAAVARAQRRERSRIAVLVVVVVVIVAAVVVAVVVTNRAGSSSRSAQIPASPRTTALGATANPPWPVPADASAAVQAAGLPMLASEGAVEHIHAHLDVIVDGKPVTVPAGVGIDQAAQKISPLHTHDTTGVIHIESPVKASFSLGQLFTEWQVSVAADHLGGLKPAGDKQLRTYVNGKPYDGDPGAIIFHAHDEIALVYGTVEQQSNVPGSYAFGQGE
jgi:flagellar basal body-associated protein FliL